MTEYLRRIDLTDYLTRPTEAEREFRRLFRPGEAGVILDIGACEGEDTVRYARADPAARILAFEPLPANQALIRANLARYGADRAELVPVALSDRDGEEVFHVSSGRPPRLFAGEDWNYGNKSSSLLPPAESGPMFGWIEFREEIRVPTRTLDQVCRERGIGRIGFIQMDVQGAELRVLRGASAMLPRVGALWLEVCIRENYRGQPLAHEIRSYLRARGFALARSFPRGDASGEGDHLYVNLRRPRSWTYLAARRAGSLLLRARTGRRSPP